VINVETYGTNIMFPIGEKRVSEHFSIRLGGGQRLLSLLIAMRALLLKGFLIMITLMLNLQSQIDMLHK